MPKASLVGHFGRRNPLWGIHDLVDSNLLTQIRDVLVEKDVNFEIAQNVNKFFTDSVGGINRNNEKWIQLFNSDPIQELARRVVSPGFLELVGNLFLESCSSYLDEKFLESIASKNQYFLFNENSSKLSLGKFKLKPFYLRSQLIKKPEIIHSLSSWYSHFNVDPNPTNFNLEAYNFIKKEKSLPFFPDMEFSCCKQGSKLGIHTDAKHHLATIMVNIPMSSAQKNSFLGTTYWKPIGKNYIINNFGLGFLSEKEAIDFKKIYVPIRTKFDCSLSTLFFRSSDSWHSFEYDSEDLGPRYTIKIHFMCPYMRQKA